MNYFTAQQLLARSPPPTIALPSKGRLAQPALEWAGQAGLRFNRLERELCVSDELGRRVFFVRAADVPLLVERGAVDLGVTGYDLIREKGLALESMPLGFGQCRISLAAPQESQLQQASDLAGKVIATSFPRIAKYFFGDLGIDVGILELSGSVEAACSLGLADAIVDIVSTGESLRKNKLAELATLIESQACLCWKKELMKT